MAETQTRPAASRGRGSGRAGRGAFSSRGGRPASHAVEAEAPPTQGSLEEQGEMGQLKKTYATELETLKELFPDWTDDDLVLALEDTDGDLGRTIERISEGNVSQFSDVKKKTKDKPRVKKDATAASEIPVTTTRGRGRGGLESGRGGRGRASDRGGRGRGGRITSSTANGNRSASTAVSIPTTETTGWGVSTTDASASMEPWEQVMSSTAGDSSASAATLSAEVAKTSLIPSGTTMSWASMLSTPKPPVVAPKHESAAPGHPAVLDPGMDEPAFVTDNGLEVGPGTPLVESMPEEELYTPTGTMRDPALDLTPPKDQLTEDNLEHLPDESQPIATETVASTRDASSVVGAGTPFILSQDGATPARPPMGGYATTAWKATGTPGRNASFQKRMMEQREAVVMPGNHAVDRAAVQFGSMGLNGESKPLEVDDDREETQTRSPVQQSPPSQPRTSLPPLPQQQQQHATEPDTLPGETNLTPRQSASLPYQSHLPTGAAQGSQQAGYGQYGRHAGNILSQESQAPTQKAYEPFAQQSSYSQAQDASSMYPNASQAPPNPNQQTHAQNAYSHGPNDYTSYGGDQQRYQNYYGSNYGQQNQQEQNAAPQRSGSAFAATDSGYGSNQPQSTHSRFGETQPASGHATPNPTGMASQQMGGNAQQVHHAQGQAQGQGNGGYPYGTPYNYGGGSYNYGGGSYMNQYSNNYYGQQGYGGPYGGKGYGQGQQGYGVSPQNAYEHSASPANAGAFANSARGSEGLGDYARSGSTQPTQQAAASGPYPTHGAEGYGRNTSGYGQGYSQQATDDSLKPYSAESKTGPSPTMSQPGRTGSGANPSGYQGQSSYQQQQSQQGFGGYQNHLGHAQGSGYGGLGGGSHQAAGQGGHQGSGYGGYGGFGNNSYQYGGRGGWGNNNYGSH